MSDISGYSIPIWPGSSSFGTVLQSNGNPTPFGYYDADTFFQADADAVADFCAKSLGYPMVDIELQDINFYTAFEQAVTEYGTQIEIQKITDNYAYLEGVPTASLNLQEEVITPHLGGIINVAKQYGNEVGVGGNIDWKKTSIELEAGVQDYDLVNLVSEAQENSASIEIKRIFHQAAPPIVRYFDPYAGTGTGIQSLFETFGFGNFSPGANFMMMPIYFDLLKIQAIEFNDQIRKSAFSFEIVNNKLRIFPVPTRNLNMFMEYVITNDRNNPAKLGKGLIRDISSVPYQNIKYKEINSYGKSWIKRYAAAITKGMLGNIRGKYSQVPIPGENVVLDGETLRRESREDMKDLLEELQANLDRTRKIQYLENKAKEGEYTQGILGNAPLNIHIG